MSAPTSFRRGLDTEIQFVKGVGPRLAALFQKAGVHNVGDLLLHIPRRYEDRTNIPPIAKLRPGTWATIRGRLVGAHGQPTRRGMVILKASVTDGTGTVNLVWFNQPWIKRKLEGYKGEIIAYGVVKESGFEYEIHSPEFELLDEDDESAEEAFARITPVYPLTEGLPQKAVRRAVADVLERDLPYLEDPAPQWLLKEFKLAPLRWALKQIHQPETDTHRTKARERLVFDEFFSLQLALAMNRADAGAELGIAFTTDENALETELRQMFPFELTRAQRKVIGEIWSDMRRPHPMNRLVQGDVGSGKTAVAAAAMLAAMRNGHQAALMAPTEILAEQHHANLQQIFEPMGIEIALLVGKQNSTDRKRALKQVASGQAGIAVGTHALIQEGVEFKKLGLVVIDEQHRFGVLQRAALREKGFGNPDVLVMTATPIPRTLTMTIYGDLDLSIIDELPPGRRAIKTHWMRPDHRPKVYEAVRKLIDEGQQAYIVCPMVSESEKMMAQAAEELHQRLSTQVYQELKVGLLHGQMKPKDKEATMEAFRRGEYHVLVSTTVIEVGVDVPNATVMVVEDANRFGLSQLHQLRGRVGRGGQQSFCILVAADGSTDAAERMQIMTETTDGFQIAEADLRLRGPGELAGTKQSGNLDFRIADLVQDGKMLEVARQAAFRILERDPKLTNQEHQALVKRAEERRSKMAAIAAA